MPYNIYINARDDIAWAGFLCVVSVLLVGFSAAFSISMPNSPAFGLFSQKPGVTNSDVLFTVPHNSIE
jgi:hypothetical protein